MSEPSAALDPLITARAAHANHLMGECDDCNGDDNVPWCDACWDDAAEWLDPSTEYGSDPELRAYLVIDALRE